MSATTKAGRRSGASPGKSPRAGSRGRRPDFALPPDTRTDLQRAVDGVVEDAWVSGASPVELFLWGILVGTRAVPEAVLDLGVAAIEALHMPEDTRMRVEDLDLLARLLTEVAAEADGAAGTPGDGDGPSIPAWPDPFDLLRQGRLADAVEAIRAHIGVARANLRRMHQHRSSILTDLERWDEALAEIDAALALSPAGDELVGFLATRGWVLSRLGRPAEGLADEDRALAIGTDDDEIAARVHLNRGFALGLLGDEDASFAEARIALGLAPSDPLAHFNVACHHSLRGRLRESLDGLRTSVVIDPSYREMARHEDDFANLAADPTLGPRFRALVGADD